MNRIFKEVIVPLGLAIFCGFVLGRYYFNVYRNNLHKELTSQKLYLIENGEYDSIDEMRLDNTDQRYIYYKDSNKYKSVVGITGYYDNAIKIKKIFDDSMVLEYYISYDEIDDKQREYDKELEGTDDPGMVREIVNNILNLYKSDDGIKLVAIN